MLQTDHVELFLENFKVKSAIWEVLFQSNRQKNTQTLADLEVSVNDAKSNHRQGNEVAGSSKHFNHKERSIPSDVSRLGLPG